MSNIDPADLKRTEVTRKAFDLKFDLIIIGAGPAGLFCAISSAEPDKKILVLEKNSFPGRKLLITGSCHCNLTHDGDVQAFLDHYGDHGRFLRSALQSFTNLDLIAFFEERGLAMIREECGKIFPATMRSKDVLRILTDELETDGIGIKCEQDVKSISRTDEGFTVRCKNRHGEDHIYQSHLLVMATGGMSYPATGSTGDGYGFIRSLGHDVAEVAPALTPVIVKDPAILDLAGISLSDIIISLFRNRKIKEVRGDVLFTHQGLSGPGILDLSRFIRAGDTIKLSFAPASERSALEMWLLQKAGQDGSHRLKSVLADLPSYVPLPARLIKWIIERCDIPEDLDCAHLTREMRILLLDHLTGFPLIVSELGGYDIAMVTRGGASLKDINPKTMQSRLVSGLYLIGELLDVDGDTGGYNLQAAFSTAKLAARSIKEDWSMRNPPC